jgi:membrane associated rhomboid family serine protease
MFLPIGDEPNPNGTPVVNISLIVVNVAVFLLVTLPLSATAIDPNAPGFEEFARHIAHHSHHQALHYLSQSSAYDLFVFQHGYRPNAPSLANLFISMFLHAGWMHLLGNMLFLWIYGDNVEHRLGPVGYLATYLGTGAAGTVFFALAAPESSTPLVGASGAISGALGCYFVWFPENLVRVLIWLYFYVDVILIPARWVLGAFVVLDNLLPYFFSSGSSGVAYGAHIGGFFAGMGVAYVLDYLDHSGSIRGWIDGRAEHQTGGTEPRPAGESASVHRLRDALAQGRQDLAAWEYFQGTSRDRAVVTADEVQAMADWLAHYGHVDPALAMLREHFSLRPQDRSAGELHLLAGNLLLGAKRPAAAYRHFTQALRLRLSPVSRERAEAGLAEIKGQQKFPL